MRRLARVAALWAALLAASTWADTTVTFEDGTQGWSGPQGGGGATVVDPEGGNPGAHLHTIFNDFGITFRNNVNPEFVGDYTRFATVTLGLDVKVDRIEFFGSPVPRPWLVDLRDFDPEPGLSPASVWFKFADIASATHGDWTPFTVVIRDTASAELPPGWGGTGDEDPKTFEPILPADRSFTDVLAGVDEIVFTTLEPGFFFGFTDFDVRIDNISIATAGAIVPGSVSDLAISKSPGTSGALVLSWAPSCGLAADYGIYEGLVGDWYSHSRIDCSDGGGDLVESITPDAGDRYYLVVPFDASAEGSYGLTSSGAERAPGGSTCKPTQNAQPCR